MSQSDDFDVPEFWLDDEDLEANDFVYSDRGPNDWLLSGPLGENGAGRGRHCDTWAEAFAYARSLHGDRVAHKPDGMPDEGPRWAIIIRGTSSGFSIR